MGFLYFLEGLRFQPLSALMAGITYLGDSVVVTIIALIFFWCINKRIGYFLLVNAIAGTSISQFLKMWFRIPRPWVLDPNFTIVEAAREAASGYSFPSGHTQCSVGLFGGLLLSYRQKWVRIVSIVFLILVPFSRMYLGVHTPMDVGVAFLCAAVLLLITWPLCKDDARLAKAGAWIMLVTLLLAVGNLVFDLTYAFPANVGKADMDEALKNGWTMAGIAAAIALTYYCDRKYTHFETAAPLLGQILKIVIGLLIVLGLKAGLKAVLRPLFHGAWVADGIRYFLMTVFAGVVWPKTFPYFAKIGAKKETAPED